MNEEQLRALYTWIDNIPLSRPKRNIARDFSDGAYRVHEHCLTKEEKELFDKNEDFH